MKVITNWRNATEEVAKAFVKKYFKHEVYGEDTSWVADEIGGVFCISDMCFNIDYMITALELKATFNQMYDYYHMTVDYHLENLDSDKPMPINFKNYVKYGMIDKK